MNEAYWQGFIEKCAELGVDPEELLKRAQVGKAVTAGVRKAMAVLLKVLRRKLPHGAAAILGGAAPQTAIPKAVSAVGRFAGGAAAAPGNLLRSLLGGLQAPEFVPELISPRSLAGRAGEIAGAGGLLGAGGLGVARLLGSKKPPEPEPSPMAGVSSQLKDWYEQLRGAVAGE